MQTTEEFFKRYTTEPFDSTILPQKEIRIRVIKIKTELINIADKLKALMNG